VFLLPYGGGGGLGPGVEWEEGWLQVLVSWVSDKKFFSRNVVPYFPSYLFMLPGHVAPMIDPSTLLDCRQWPGHVLGEWPEHVPRRR